MGENYTHARLQFGQNDLRVPGSEVDAHSDDNPVQIPPYLADPNQNLWGLVFSYHVGSFYLAGQQVNDPMGGQVVNSWYSKIGKDPGGVPTLTVHPFADGQFLKPADFLDFSEPSPYENSIPTDTIVGPSVTATSHYDLPDLAQIKTFAHATSTSVVITMEITKFVFDHYFVIYGSGVANGNLLTVEKDGSCMALAVYRKEKSTSTKEISTRQWPRIRRNEWPQIVEQVVESILVKGKGEIYQHFTTGQLTEMEPEALRTALDEISMQIGDLESLKLVIASLAEKR